MTSLLIILSVVFISIFALVKFLEHTVVFFPGDYINTTPAQVGLVYEDLFITTSDGVKINAWFVKSSRPNASTIIFAHGNAGTMSERVMKAKYWYDLGLNVLMFDYRGYGRSQGKPTEKGVYLDAQAVYDYLLSRSDVDAKRLIGYGTSLGGVVIIDLAIHRSLSAVVVESSVTSAKKMSQLIYPFLPSFMIGIQFDSLSKISKINVPKLFMHSKEDQTVPFSMGQELFEAASEPKSFIVIHGGHNDSTTISDPRVRNEFITFLNHHSLL